MSFLPCIVKIQSRFSLHLPSLLRGLSGARIFECGVGEENGHHVNSTSNRFTLIPAFSLAGRRRESGAALEAPNWLAQKSPSSKPARPPAGKSTTGVSAGKLYLCGAEQAQRDGLKIEKEVKGFNRVDTQIAQGGFWTPRYFSQNQ